MEQESFDFLDDLFEPILVAEIDGSILYFNSSFLTLFKTTPRFLKKQKHYKDYFTSIVPDFPAFCDELEKSGQLLSSELNFVIEGQLCTIIIKGVKKENGLVLLSFKDMTVEKNLNDKYRAQLLELKNTHAQIIQSDKLKVIGEMTANISHEINNPLTVAIGNCELFEFALESADLNLERANLVKFHKNINHSLERINKIISNMKEFLHKSEDKKEYCSAKEIVDKAITFTRPSVKGTSIDIAVETNEEGPILLINKVKIEQVFVNLLQNAIDSLKAIDIADPKIIIRMQVEKSGNFVHITVSDNGPGISAENKEKIFNTFFTTKEVGKGTGLGLSISKRIVEAHQGRLELIDSDTGATFQVTLPAMGIASKVHGNWEKLIVDGDHLKKVLVVDNELNILNLCMNFLADSDYHFLGASSAEEAFLELEREKVDLIITDLKMPRMDGDKFIRELRKKNKDVPVLFMTAKDHMDKYILLKDELGLKGIILKPFTKDELTGTIAAALK